MTMANRVEDFPRSGTLRTFVAIMVVVVSEIPCIVVEIVAAACDEGGAITVEIAVFALVVKWCVYVIAWIGFAILVAWAVVEIVL